MAKDDENDPDDLFDDGDEEEEEEEEEGRARKRTSANYFLDDEAEVDDDEDDDEEVDEGAENFVDSHEAGDATQETRSRASAREALSALDNRRDNRGRGFNDLIRRIEENEGNIEEEDDLLNDEEEEDYDYGATPVSRQGLLPSVKDPKLWMVKTKPGRERDIITLIMQKFYDRLTSPEPLLIKSVVAPDHLKGHIYVEADRDAHVRDAIKGIRNTFQFMVKLVPIKEMPDVLTVNKKAIHVEKGSWVRIKRGLYKDDIGQVSEYDEARGRAIVKIIPRLDYSDASQGGGTQEKRKRKTRLPARFFNADEAILNSGPNSVEKRRDHLAEFYFVFNGQKFKDGYLFKSLNIKSLDVNGVVPTIDELTRFQEAHEAVGEKNGKDADGKEKGDKGDKDKEKEEPPPPVIELHLPQVKRIFNFSKGDVVKVVEGDLKHLMGVVESIDENTITIMPKHAELHELLQFPAHQLQRYFKIGDHVKVISGKYTGETGMVVKIDGNVAIVHSDMTNADLKVLVHDIQEAMDVSSGKMELGNYELHDLVQIEPNRFGVIIKIEQTSFRLLDQHGTVTSVELKAMGHKRNSRDAVAMDKFQNQLHEGDMLQVTDGPHRGKHGTVKHIVRYFVWCFSREYLENGGIFVVRAGSCQLMGAKAKNLNLPPSLSRSIVQSPRHQIATGQAAGPRRRGVDPMLNKTVLVKSGVWKGYLGIVKDVTESTARVELHTKCKTINVARDNLHEVGAPIKYSPATSSLFAPQTPVWGGRTPLREDPMATPLRTPMTPSRSYDTPSHDPWNPNIPNTPMRPTTPSHDSDWNTPSGYHSSNSTPRSSYFSPFSPAPTSDFNPSTPGNSGNFNTPSYTTPSTNYNDLPTPLLSNNNMYANVGTPVTPSIPQTPLTPSDGLHMNDDDRGTTNTPSISSDLTETNNENDDNGIWVMKDIQVSISSPSYLGGVHVNSKGVVLDSMMDGNCTIELEDGTVLRNVPQDVLKPIVPTKKERIRVLRGEYKSLYGFLVQLHGEDGIIRMDGKDKEIKVLKLENIARISEKV